jgi:large subunit ribosomal protein L28
MAQVCELTGKRPAYGNKVSHSNIKTRIRWMPNLRKKKYMIPELGQSMAIMLSSRAIRTIDKLGGISAAIMNANEKSLSERLQQVRGKIYRARVKSTQTPKSAKAKAPKAEKVAKAKVAKPAKAAKAKTK